MKAIAVIKEMPNDCDECLLVDENCYCILLNEDAFPNEWVENAPYYSLKEKGSCPLKPLPSKLVPFGYLDAGNEDGLYEKGYNDCIDEIIGEA